MNTFLQDLRFAARMLVKNPGFALVAVLALGLGLGAVTMTFSAFNAVLLRPLPLIQRQEELVAVSQAIKSEPDTELGLSLPDYQEVNRQAKTLEGLVVHQPRTFILTDNEEPERLLGASISARTFAVLGVKPALGRDFRPDEESPGAAPVVLLGHGIWQRRYAGDTGIVGRAIRISGNPATIVGVMPPGWRYPEESDIWMPLRVDATEHKRGNHFLEGVARLKPGVTIAEARAELATISTGLGDDYPETKGTIGFRLEPLREWITRDTRQLMKLVLGAVLFVQLIACANVANLLLARGSVRLKEISIRLALGAPRRRVIQQLLTESLLLAFAGGVLGLVLAMWGGDVLWRGLPRELPFWVNVGFDGRVFAVAFGTAVVSALIFGLLPAWQLTKPGLVEEIKEGGRGSMGGARHHRLRNALVVAEVALALVLLVGAGLMMRSFWKTRSLDPGFDPRGVLTFRVGLPPAYYTNKQDYIDFFQEVTRRLNEIPGVEAAGAISFLPANQSSDISLLQFEGRPEPKLLEAPRFNGMRTTSRTLAAFGIPLRQGRMFTGADMLTNSPPVVLVDEAFAQRHFPGGDPLGKRFRRLNDPGQEPMPWVTIVGVVGNVRTHFDNRPQLPAVYFPHPQLPDAFMSVALRVKGDPAGFAAAAQREVFAVNRAIPIYYPLTMAQVIARATWDKQFFGTIFGFFAALALFLSALGIYGVMAYSVSQRTQEIGVRMALGAQARDVVGMVVKGGVKLVTLGLVIGLFAAFLLTRLLTSVLYGVSPYDPPVFGLVPLILAAVGVVACWMPARRATRIDPVLALRTE